LIKHVEPIKWNEIRLDEYYQQHADQLSTYTGPIKDTWSIGNSTVLIARLELDFTQVDDVLNITISEGIENGRIKGSVRLNPRM
jgi:hypothetical protein